MSLRTLVMMFAGALLLLPTLVRAESDGDREAARNRLQQTVREDQISLDALLDKLDALITPEALPMAKNPPGTLLGLVQDMVYQARQKLRHLAPNACPEQAALGWNVELLLWQMNSILADFDIHVSRGMLPDELDTRESAHAKVAELRVYVRDIAARRLDEGE